ncbi:MAG TPA: conjugative transfer signal peptidase TraF [Polyangiaceae bacterium]|nr:conjugative transfer signal peptidase TraF [Polyangiaceae bacterium]
MATFNPTADLPRFYARVLGTTILLSVATSLLARHLIVNCTESMPLGLYWLSRGSRPRSGDLVAFPVPSDVASLVRARRYLPDGALLLKQVVAVPGDRVCTDGDVLSINDVPFGPIAAHDSEGRVLPHPTACGVVRRGQIYVASRDRRSFDSRSFGPVRMSDIRGTVTPVWTVLGQRAMAATAWAPRASFTGHP